MMKTTSTTIQKSIKCTIRINGELFKRETDELISFPLYFKEDGNRFSVEQTLKMLVSFSYHFDILLERTQSQIRFIKVNIGVEPDVHSSSMDLIDYLYEPNHTRVSFVWDSTGKMPDPKKKRDFLIISIVFFDMTILKIQFQVRFYEKFGKHYSWGEELDHCKATCTLDGGKHDMVITPTLHGKPRYFI